MARKLKRNQEAYTKLGFLPKQKKIEYHQYRARCAVRCDTRYLNFFRTHDHKSFPGVGISGIFDLTFLPGGGEFFRNVLKMSNSRPMNRKI